MSIRRIQTILESTQVVASISVKSHFDCQPNMKVPFTHGHDTKSVGVRSNWTSYKDEWIFTKVEQSPHHHHVHATAKDA